MPKDEQYRVVYSTESGKICLQCQKSVEACECEAIKKAQIVGDGAVRVRLEKSGRGGKTVSVVRGLPVDQTALQKLGSELKKMCGTGGAVKDGTVEIQGDHVEKLIVLLTARGFKAKRGGG